MTQTVEWPEMTILAASEKIMDYRGRTPKKLGMEWGGGRIPAISARNVRMGHIDFTEDYYVGSESLYRRWMTQGDVQEGDPVITTEAPLGNVAAIPDSQRYILSQRTVLIRPKPELFDKCYFLKALQAPRFQRLLTQNATGSTALGIQRRKLEQLTVPMPSLGEQRQIAESLTDIESLTTTLDLSIVKKQAIRHGMMQQLLTGRTRLPGFSEPWSVCPLFELVTIRSGQVDPREPQYRQLTLIAPDHVEVGTGRLLARKSAADQHAISGKYLAHKGDIIYGKINPHLKKVARATELSLCSADMYPLSPHERVDGAYIFYHLLGEAFTKFAISLSRRSGIPKVNREELRGYDVPTPNLEEQQAISAVLLSIDAEIDVLIRRLAKARAVEHGMMQQLLTGRIRLPVEAAS